MNSFISFFLKIRNSKFFNGLVIAVIIASALYAGISSYDLPAEYIYYLLIFDYAITVFFLIELIIRMIAERDLGKFYKDGWNIFDTIIDPDREMFYHWLTFYTENTRNCFQNTDDLEEGTACYLGA